MPKRGFRVKFLSWTCEDIFEMSPDKILMFLFFFKELLSNNSENKAALAVSKVLLNHRLPTI